MDEKEKDCWCCGRRCHTRAECYHRTKTCGHCGKVGHMRATCRRIQGPGRTRGKQGEGEGGGRKTDKEKEGEKQEKKYRKCQRLSCENRSGPNQRWCKCGFPTIPLEEQSKTEKKRKEQEEDSEEEEEVEVKLTPEERGERKEGQGTLWVGCAGEPPATMLQKLILVVLSRCV